MLPNTGSGSKGQWLQDECCPNISPSTVSAERMRHTPSKKRSALALQKTTGLDNSNFSYDLTPVTVRSWALSSLGFLRCQGMPHSNTGRHCEGEAIGLVVTLFRGLCVGSGQQTRLVSSLLYLGLDGAPWRYTQSCRLSCTMTRCRRWWVFLPIISFWSLCVPDMHIVQNDMYVWYMYYRLCLSSACLFICHSPHLTISIIWSSIIYLLIHFPSVCFLS